MWSKDDRVLRASEVFRQVQRDFPEFELLQRARNTWRWSSVIKITEFGRDWLLEHVLGKLPAIAFKFVTSRAQGPQCLRFVNAIIFSVCFCHEGMTWHRGKILVHIHRCLIWASFLEKMYRAETHFSLVCISRCFEHTYNPSGYWLPQLTSLCLTGHPVHMCSRTNIRGGRQFNMFMSENICTMVDLFNKAVAVGVR